MRDYTFNGVPVRQMARDDIVACLVDGEVEIIDNDGLSDCRGRVIERLRIELVIRDILDETH